MLCISSVCTGTPFHGAFCRKHIEGQLLRFLCKTGQCVSQIQQNSQFIGSKKIWRQEFVQFDQNHNDSILLCAIKQVLLATFHSFFPIQWTCNNGIILVLKSHSIFWKYYMFIGTRFVCMMEQWNKEQRNLTYLPLTEMFTLKRRLPIWYFKCDSCRGKCNVIHYGKQFKNRQY